MEDSRDVQDETRNATSSGPRTSGKGSYSTSNGSKQTADKRVEFTIGYAKKSSTKISRARPKSVLKRFNIESHRFVTQKMIIFLLSIVIVNVQIQN